jgi:hypothetical protein
MMIQIKAADEICKAKVAIFSFAVRQSYTPLLGSAAGAVKQLASSPCQCMHCMRAFPGSYTVRKYYSVRR